MQPRCHLEVAQTVFLTRITSKKVNHHHNWLSEKVNHTAAPMKLVTLALVLVFSREKPEGAEFAKYFRSCQVSVEYTSLKLLRTLSLRKKLLIEKLVFNFWCITFAKDLLTWWHMGVLFPFGPLISTTV